MTILPTKRAVNNDANDESNGNSGAHNAKDRSLGLREEHNDVVTENSPDSAPPQFTYGNSGDRKGLQKIFKGNSVRNLREQQERERRKLRELRRKRKRNRQSKRAENKEPEDSSEQSNVIVEKKDSNNVDEDGSGCNSEDEYDSRRSLTIASPSVDEWERRDAYFSKSLLKLGFIIKKMHEDGACLFRAIADQVYGDQELHSTVRSHCMDYIMQNRDFFAPYVTEDFDKYVERKRRWNVHGNHLEIQAFSEMYNRTIEVYCYHTDPINIFNASSINSYEPIRVSYHRMCHYNSITNPKRPSVLVGLGLPNYSTRCDLDRRDLQDAVRQSEDMLIEQTMLEDKILATDWEATNEALEEQAARESYIQFYRDVERRLKAESHLTASSAAGSSSTVTSEVCSRSSCRDSVSPQGSVSPKESSSPRYSMEIFEKLEFNQILLSDSVNLETAYRRRGMDLKKRNENTDRSDLGASKSKENSYEREIYTDWDDTVTNRN